MSFLKESSESELEDFELSSVSSDGAETDDSGQGSLPLKLIDSMKENKGCRKRECSLAEINLTRKIEASAPEVVNPSEKESPAKKKRMEPNSFRNRQQLLYCMLNQSSRNLDLAFMVDCTGSMDPFIAQTKIQIKNILLSLEKQFKEVRVAFVGYRDHSDGEDRIVYLDFQDDVKTIIKYINMVEVFGGEDRCEDVFGGLEQIISLDWKNPLRILIHVADAPQHGTRFHSKIGDSYKSFNDADPRNLKVEDLISKIQGLGIKYGFGKINNTTGKMIREFCKVAQDKNFVRVVDVKNPTNILEFILSTTLIAKGEKTMAIMLARTCTVTFTAAQLTEFAKQGNVVDAEILKAKLFHYTFPVICDLKNIRKSIDRITPKSRNECIQKAKNHFSEGTQRYSYHGLLGQKRKQVVFKKFKNHKFASGCIDHVRIRQEYELIVQVQTIACYLAREFNKLAPNRTPKISFIEVSLIEAHDLDGNKVYYNSEELLVDYKDKFTKWSNNAGFTKKDTFNPCLDAFCHWTYEVTNGYLMVVDIQGVLRDDGYVLTDPSIHCVDDEFGETNFGKTGMWSFFQTHTCNKICKSFGFKVPPPKEVEMALLTPSQ